MLYLAPYISVHTRTALKLPVYQPAGTEDVKGWGSTDLRPRGSRAGYSLVWLPGGSADARLEPIALDPEEALTAGIRTRVGNRLSLTLDHPRADRLIEELLFTGDKPWAFARPRRDGVKEAWIYGRRWARRRGMPPPVGQLVDPSDDFNRADETPIASPWFVPTGVSFPPRLVGNQFGANSGASDVNSIAGYTGAAATGDHFSQYTVKVLGTASDQAVCVRVQSDAETFYGFDIVDADEQLLKFVSSSYTKIASLTMSNAVVDDVIRLEISGSSLTAKLNGGTVTGSPQTDTSITGGQPGINMLWAAQRGDDWSGGDLVAPSAPMFRGA